MSPDEIIYHYPSIGLADVHTALAYYYDRVEQIRKDIESDEAFAREVETKHPSLVQQKLSLNNG